jgi:predicted phage tail protein
MMQSIKALPARQSADSQEFVGVTNTAAQGYPVPFFTVSAELVVQSFLPGSMSKTSFKYA